MEGLNLIQKLGELIGSQNVMVLAFSVVLVSLMIDLIQRRVLRQIQKQAAQTANLWDDAIIHAKSAAPEVDADSVAIRDMATATCRRYRVAGLSVPLARARSATTAACSSIFREDFLSGNLHD